MATIKHIFKGESLTMLFTFPAEYDMARIQSHGIWIGGTEFTGVIIGQGIELKLTSLQTDMMSGNRRVSLWIDDSQLGVRKPYVGDLAVGNTNALPDNESTSEVYDVIVNVDISVTSIEAGDLMFNYVKGAPLTYDDLTPEQKAELQQPATDAIASIQEVELAVETAEGLRQQAEINRQTNTATAIQNAETATTGANNAASLANEKAGLANNAATLANEKAGLAATATTQANDARDGANSAAQSATNLVNSYATDLAAKELKANKQNSLEPDGTGTKFPTVDAVNAGLGNSGIRALFIARGATYNATTGFYSLNGLTDITEAQMMDIYNYTSQLINSLSLDGSFARRSIRTNYNTTNVGYLIVSARYSFVESAIEVFKQNNLITGNCTSMFRDCLNLTIVDYISLGNTSASNYTNMFLNCTALVTCLLRSIASNLSLQWSPLLSLASLQYLIQYRANGTTPITITVHPTVFAKLTDNTNYPTWYAVNQDALTKYITFASA